MTLALAISVCALPTLAAVIVGVTRLRRAFERQELLPEEVALGAAWFFLVGSFIWLVPFLSNSRFLGFGAPLTWLAAAHFAAAGFGALTVTAFACRAVSEIRALRILRFLLVAHPVAYFATAAGISGIAYCSEIGAALYEVIFVAQLFAVVFGRPNRIARGPRRLLVLALAVPVATLVPSLAWAWGSPFLDLAGMIRYHGLVNAIGHVGLGLAAFGLGETAGPLTHSLVGRQGGKFAACQFSAFI